MDKKFKEKLERNRNGNFGMEKKKYTPKTNKPRPNTYEMTIENGEASYNDALWIIKDHIPELSDFINSIFVSEDESSTWFDESISRVASYFTQKVPQLQSKQGIHTKLSLDVNGFSVRFEDNITFDIHCRYNIEDGVAVITNAHMEITTHGKVSKTTYEYLKNRESGWTKKMFKKKFTPRNNKEVLLEEESDME